MGNEERLWDAIADARRRTIAARAALAGVNDTDVRYVRAAQCVLSEDHEAVCRHLAAVASGAGVGLDQILRPSASTLGLDLARQAGSGRSGGPLRPPREAGYADPAMLESELHRLCRQAEVLEQQVRRAQGGPSGDGRQPAPGLEAALSAALEVTRAQNLRWSEEATNGTAHGFVAARVAAAPPGSSPYLRSDGSFAPLDPSTQFRAGIGGIAPDQSAIAVPKVTASSRREQPDGVSGVPMSPAAAARPIPREGRASSRPMILDVVLPIIAVAIVLLVVLSWIG
jgi:hypothetical protein